MTGRHAWPSVTPSWDLDAMLAELNGAGWTVAALGERAAPTVLVAWQRLGDHVDVITIRGEDSAAAYRAPAWPDEDPLAVTEVTWCYIGSARVALRQLLTLGPVDHGWPRMPIPVECRVPEAERRPMTIRPPQ